MRRHHGLVILAGLFAFGATETRAAFIPDIPGLYNTGLDAAGNPLGEAAVDPHYTIIAGPVGPEDAVAVTGMGFPMSVWADNTPTSQWIRPASAPRSDSVSPATYIYRLVFDLTGFDLATVEISGLWGVDNNGEILLNGASTLIVTDGDPDNFQVLDPFAIDSGFVPGLNTLDFVVENVPGAGGNPNPTGLRVANFTGTGDSEGDPGTPGVVPEPTSLSMLTLGALGLVGYGWRRRKQSAAA